MKCFFLSRILSSVCKRPKLKMSEIDFNIISKHYTFKKPTNSNDGPNDGPNTWNSRILKIKTDLTN